MASEESTARQRKLQKTDEADVSEVKVPKPEKKKSRKKREAAEEEDDYTVWVDVLRVLSFLLIASFGLSYLVTGGESWFWGAKHRPDYLTVAWWKLQLNGPAYITPEELARFDGSDPNGPVYLSIGGNVYDVSAGRHIYGPGGSYHHFAGVDSSRGFVTGCFTEDRNGDLRGLETMFLPIDNPEIDEKYWTAEELAQLKAKELETAKARVQEAVDNWVAFFAKSNKYHFVGKLKREPGWEGELKPLCQQAQDGRSFRKAPTEQ